MRKHNTYVYIEKYKKQQEILEEIKDLKKKERWLILSYSALSKDQQDELEEIWNDINKLNKQYSELQEEMNDLVEKGVFMEQISKTITLGII